MIPAFDPATGALPAGIHESDWASFVTRYGTTPRRVALLAGMQRALVSLANAGCTRVYLGGSFVTTKPEPGDWDGCFEAEGMNFFRLDKALARSNRLAMKDLYFGELYNAADLAITGQAFRDFFQSSRASQPVGVIALNPAAAR